MTAENNRKSVWVAVATFVAVVGAIGAGALGISRLRGNETAAKGKADDAERPPVSVQVAPVTLRPIQRSVQVVGTFRGFEEVSLTPKVEGRVIEIHHEASDAVVLQPGELLLEIDPTDYKLAVEERSRELESELAKLELYKTPGEDVDVEQLLATLDIEDLKLVQRAAHVEKLALDRRDRAQQLIDARVISPEDLEQTKTDYLVAKANREQAMVDAKTTRASALYKAALLATAKQRLRDTKVVVPAPTRTARNQWEKEAFGRVEKPGYAVAKCSVAEGEIVRPASAAPLFKLVMDDPITLQAAVPERYASQVKEGQAAQITVESTPEVFAGTISRVAPAVDPVSRTFQIEAVVLNPRRVLKSGGFAKLAILTKVDPQARTVPIEAVIAFVGTSRVFAVEDGRARAVPVVPATVDRRGGWIEVEGDLKPDAVVVTDGNRVLVDGSPVKVRER